MREHLLSANSGGKADRRCVFRTGREEGGIYVIYEAQDSYFFTPYSKDNEPLYDGSVVELFLAEKGNACDYAEYEFAPNGAVFCGRINHDGKANLTLTDTAAVKSTVTRIGGGYRVEAHIKTDIDFGKALFNAYRIERKCEGAPYELYALFPTECETFHVPDKMRLYSEYAEK